MNQMQTFALSKPRWSSFFHIYVHVHALWIYHECGGFSFRLKIIGMQSNLPVSVYKIGVTEFDCLNPCYERCHSSTKSNSTIYSNKPMFCLYRVKPHVLPLPTSEEASEGEKIVPMFPAINKECHKCDHHSIVNDCCLYICVEIHHYFEWKTNSEKHYDFGATTQYID